MKTFKIGIRQQLICLVTSVALMSLMVLAIITGVYFSTNYKSIRADRLQVIAQLKASQTEQNLNFLYYEAGWLSSRDTVQDALASYRAGNTSQSNWSDAYDTIEQFLSSTVTFTNVRVYDAVYKQVMSSPANWSSNYVSEDVLNQLFPLSDSNATLSDSLRDDGMLSGPVSNATQPMLSMTIPVYATASILYDTSDLVGFVTTVMVGESLNIVTEDDTALKKSSVYIIATENSNSTTKSSTYTRVLPCENNTQSEEHTIGSNYIATQSLLYSKTSAKTSTKDDKGNKVAAGYCPVNFSLTKWAAVVEQAQGTFNAPANQLTGIIVGVVFGTAIFMAILTFPLAHWAVQPVLNLQKATELIATGRGLQVPTSKHHKKDGSSGGGSSRGSFGFARRNSGSSTTYPPSNPVMNQNTTNNAGDGEKIDKNVETGSMGSDNFGPIGADNRGHPSYLQEARVPEYKRIFEDELSQLTQTFNAMTDELDRQYSHLEDRVKARTKQLEAAKIQAESANEAKTVFIANISHELRTPLNGILGMTAIAMAESDPSKIQQSLKLIFRSGELLLHILTELLTFSKNSLKRSKLENADFCVMEVALQIKSIFGKLAKDQNVHLSINLTPNEIRKMVLYGDSNRIIQIVMNLVSNSLKFTPVDGRVTVTVRTIGEYDEARSKAANYEKVFVKPNTIPRTITSTSVINEKPSDETIQHNSSSNESSYDEDLDDTRSIMTVSTCSYDENIFQTQFKLSDPGDDGRNLKTKTMKDCKKWVFEFIVEDTGPGIDPNLQKSVFEPFVQGDQTLSRQYGGTGLGLSICSQLAHMMNGVMELESTVGVGSKFTFKVPLTQQKELLFDENDLSNYEDEFNTDSKKSRRVKIQDPKNTSKSMKENGTSPFNEESNDYFQRPILSSTGTARQISTHSSSTNSSSSTSKNSNSTSTPVTNSSSSEYSIKDLKILVAEDNNVNQEVIKRMLNLDGISDIELAIDGEEAVNHVKSTMEKGIRDYDIIFMDVQMPKVDGLMATKQIINELGYPGPIVALTAFADESNVKECLDAGMVGFLSKPIRRSQLKKLLTQFCATLPKSRKGTNISENGTKEE